MRFKEVELVGHTAKIYSADWSADGSRVTTSAADGTVRLWDAQTGDAIAIFERPAARASAGCRRAATGSGS